MTCRAAGNQLEGAEQERERQEKEEAIPASLGAREMGSLYYLDVALPKISAKPPDPHQEAASANGGCLRMNRSETLLQKSC